MDHYTIVTACGQFGFSDPRLAVEFMRMLAHQIPVDQFVSMVKALVSDQAAHNAREIANTCLGMPL